MEGEQQRPLAPPSAQGLEQTLLDFHHRIEMRLSWSQTISLAVLEMCAIRAASGSEPKERVHHRHLRRRQLPALAEGHYHRLPPPRAESQDRLQRQNTRVPGKKRRGDGIRIQEASAPIRVGPNARVQPRIHLQRQQRPVHAEHLSRNPVLSRRVHPAVRQGLRAQITRGETIENSPRWRESRRRRLF